MSALPNYLDCLNPEQRQAVEHEGSPLLILAGAGSGKTRVITTKIAYLISEKGVEPRSILAVTFTKKAAAEMRERAVQLERRADGAVIRTFHSFGAWFLRTYSVMLDASATPPGVHPLSPNFTVYDDEDSATLVAKAMPQLDKAAARSAARCIALAKDYCLSPDDDLSQAAGNWDTEELRAIYRAYQSRLSDTGNADFGDLIMLPAFMLERNDALSKRMQDRLKVVMVDEYQDSNVAQFRLLRALVGDVQETGVYVCVVGDDDQSIYKFRGAEVANILRFADVFPGTETVTLSRNYRSTNQILQAAQNVVRHNTSRLDKTLSSERGAGEMPSLVYLDDQDAEARFCADMISEAAARGEAHYKDWAILYRSNAQSRAFEREFLRRKMPYIVVGTLKFYEREEVKDVLAVLSLVVNGYDEVSFRRVVNKPSRGAGAKTIDAVIEAARESKADLLETADEAAGGKGLPMSKKAAAGLREFCSVISDVKDMLACKDTPLSAVVERAAVRSGLMDYHKDDKRAEKKSSATAEEREANIHELAASSLPYECSIEGLLEFLQDIDLAESGGDVAASDAVTLITVHNTKGLEFPRVILTGVETGVFPHGNEDAEGMEEERRLFYVGVTRAKDTLCITTCVSRYLYGHVSQMTPSRFIDEASDVFNVIDKRWRYKYLPSPRDEAVLLEADGFARGVKVYSDDYGYGYVIRHEIRNGETVVTVQFESGGTKCFMPQYQPGALQAVEV